MPCRHTLSEVHMQAVKDYGENPGELAKVGMQTKQAEASPAAARAALPSALHGALHGALHNSPRWAQPVQKCAVLCADS